MLIVKILINPSLDVVNINAFAQFGQIPSICSQDIDSDINQGHNYVIN